MLRKLLPQSVKARLLGLIGVALSALIATQ